MQTTQKTDAIDTAISFTLNTFVYGLLGCVCGLIICSTIIGLCEMPKHIANAKAHFAESSESKSLDKVVSLSPNE